MVRGLTSCQCGLASNPGPSVLRGFIVRCQVAPRRFFSRFCGFPPSTKTSTSVKDNVILIREQ